MDVVTIDGRTVVKCVHCNGSGACHHAVYAIGVNHAEHPVSFMNCPKCGAGGLYLAQVGLFKKTYINHSAMQRPVCAVCGGSGHVRV